LKRRNVDSELCYEKPDPILVARRYKDPYVSLVCALYGYGRADLIVRFLDTLDMSLIDENEETIRRELAGKYYRFQSSEDIVQSFITLRRMKQSVDMEEVFKTAYNVDHSVISGLNAVISSLSNINKYESRGYQFLFGSPVKKPKGGSTSKRWMMFLRWMVRHDNIDMGLWRSIDKADLIMPLDTHTFNVSRRLGLLQRRQYDMQAAIELTETLKTFDPADPVKYDFALYRLGQEKAV
jgi:uncharacterized protein (TIGR02757 family)